MNIHFMKEEFTGMKRIKGMSLDKAKDLNLSFITFIPVNSSFINPCLPMVNLY
jgi:hypothetical protein